MVPRFYVDAPAPLLKLATNTPLFVHSATAHDEFAPWTIGATM